MNAKDQAVLEILSHKESATPDDLFRIISKQYRAGGRPALVKSLERLRKLGYLRRIAWTSVAFPCVEYRVIKSKAH